jgi:cytochrome P450
MCDLSEFIDLPVSVFDPEFTLNPYPVLEDLYPREDVLGFRSEGMDFLFRHADCRAVLKSPLCRREPLANPEFQQREARYAEMYPNRLWEMSNNFSMGEVDIKLKSQLVRLLGNIEQTASFEGMQPIFQQLSEGGDLSNYIEQIATLPLRVILYAAGFPATQQEISEVYNAGCTYLKSFENLGDETLIKDADLAVVCLRDFVDRHYDELRPNTLIHDHVLNCKDIGLSDEKIRSNLIGPILISASNTMGISSAFFLRNLIRYPDVRKKLQANPALLDNDNVILEFLRRDNHVKALSRHAHGNLEIGNFELGEGSSVSLFFPGANLDPAQWKNPLAIDFNRDLNQQNHIIFGGAKHVCIGKTLAVSFLRKLGRGFLQYLPDSVHVEDSEIEVDGSWVAERIITRMPIRV